jgi:hypothetical protein
MESGYTLLWRKAWKNPVLHEKGRVFSKFEAWLYLVNVVANGVDKGDLKRGEFEASYRYMANAFNWTIPKTHRFIKACVCENMIKIVERQTEQQSTHFIISKYYTYNPSRNAERNAERNKSNEGLKEGLKTKSPADAAVDHSPSPEALGLSEKLRLAIATRDARSKAARMPDLSLRWAPDIDRLLRIDKRTVEECVNVIAWCQSPDCWWGPNIQSGKKLREKFDVMWGQMNRGNGKSYKPDTIGQAPEDTGEPNDPEYQAEINRRAEKLFGGMP